MPTDCYCGDFNHLDPVVRGCMDCSLCGYNSDHAIFSDAILPVTFQPPNDRVKSNQYTPSAIPEILPTKHLFSTLYITYLLAHTRCR